MRTVLILVLVGCSGPSEDTGPAEPTAPVAGERCALDERIAQVTLSSYGGAVDLSAAVYDRADPWVGAPALDNDHCAFHTFSPGSCGPCDAGMVCAVSGGCEPARRTIRQATIEVHSGGGSETFTPNAETGTMFGQIATSDSAFEVVLTWPGHSVTLPTTPLADPDLAVSVVSTGSYDEPGALDVSWSPQTSATHVGTVIPINHHAGGPTFTSCHAPVSAGSFRADADMVDPLAVSTGLEFQGVSHFAFAAAETAGGCVEFRLGSQWHVDVTFE